jgi:flagellar hook-length control protein FliK
MSTAQLGIFLSDSQASTGPVNPATAGSGSGVSSFSDGFSQTLNDFLNKQEGTDLPVQGMLLPTDVASLPEGLPEELVSQLQSMMQNFFGDLGDLSQLSEQELNQAFADLSQQITDLAAQFNIQLPTPQVQQFIQGLSQNLSPEHKALSGAEWLQSQMAKVPTDKQNTLAGKAAGAIQTGLNGPAVASPGSGNVSLAGLSGSNTLDTSSSGFKLESLQLLKQSVQSENFGKSSVLDGLQSLVSNSAATSLAASFEETAPVVTLPTINPATAPQESVDEATVSLQKIPVPPTNKQFSQELSDRIMVMASRNIQSAEIQLTPPELGALMVKISVEGDQANVAFSSPNAGVREALEQQSFRLKDMLEEQGVELVDVDVSDQEQQHKAHDEEEMLAANGNSDEELDGLEFIESLEEQKSVTATMNLVDYFA